MSLRLILLFVLMQAITSFTQKGEMVTFELDKQKFKQRISATNSMLDVKRNAVAFFRLQGYVGIVVKDSIQKKENWYYRFSHKKHFQKVVLEHENETIITSLTKTPKQINNLLTELENSGFPFAKISFTKQHESNKSLSLSFKIDSGQLVTIRKVIIKSQDKFDQKTIENLIGIKSGEPYNESKIRAIDLIFANSGLFELIRAPQLLFMKEEADIYLTVKKINTSTADGFIGFQQNADNQKIELNGNINLSLKNNLNRGELLDFKWQGNAQKSQNLNIETSYPFLIGLPLEIGGKINIQKQDTTFIRNGFSGQIKYLASFYSIGIFGQSESSFLIGENNAINSSGNFSEFKRNTFGLNGNIKPGTNKRYRSELFFKIGAFNLSTDSIESNTSIANLLIDGSVVQNIRLIKSFSFVNRVQYKEVISNQNLTENQLFYFGGLKSVRGFYELELNGNHVLSVNNALVFKPVKQLSFELIYDYAQFHSATFTQTNTIGFGFNVENQNNTLSLILANGTIRGNPFIIQNTKLHLGFISRF